MSTANLTRDEALARARLISEPRYQVALDLTRGDEVFGVDAVVRFRCAEPGAATFIEFIASAIHEVTLNGAPVDISRAFNGTRIRLEGLAAENELHMVADGGYQRNGIGMHRATDPVDGLAYCYSDAEPYEIHRVYPCFDQPDIKGRFTFEVTAPDQWQVASNTVPAEKPADGKGGVWRFPETAPMSTYITCVAAGPYHVVRTKHGGIELGLWCRKTLAPYLEADEIFEVTKQGFDFYAKAFDYPYPFDKYDQLFVPEFNSGAMENWGCVTFNEEYLFRSKVTDAARERRAEVILHEMAHMWFGNLVTMSWWDDLWLNESFASWAAVYSQSLATRWRNAWVSFADSEKTWAYRQDQLATTHPIVADIPDIASTKVNFDGITYAKGASVLKQLVAWVGEDAFLAGLRTYFRRHEYGNTDLSDFLAALEESSGRDLHAWAKEWLQAAGVNTLRPAFETSDGTFRSLEVLQEAPEDHPTVRSHRIAIGLYDARNGSFEKRSRIELDVTGARTPVPDVAGQPVPDLLLLNDDDLTFAKIRLDRSSFETLVDRLASLQDPLARALCWSAAWDMTRDAEIRAGEYLELVLRNIEGETEIGVRQSLLAQAAAAINAYGAPDKRVAGLDRLAAAALEGLRSAPSGGDHQLAWARCFIASAQADEHLEHIRGLLEGSASEDGLTVDTDLRWHIVRALAASGTVGEELIAREEATDPTDKGHREATAARAARASADAKSQAWETLVGDPPLPYAMLRATIGGFQQSGQRDLLEPYRDRYFEVLGRIWESRELEVALGFTAGLYPRVVIEQKTVDDTDRYIENARPSAALRRLLNEGRDDTLRALRARAKDAS
ncbi:MAG: aminopeptidase N [Actinomycetota bacterium]